MWYALQVCTGQEEKILKLCNAYVSDASLVKFFCPQYEEWDKKSGERMIIKRILFPGYLFFKTEEIEKVYLKLKKFPEFTKVLSVGKDCIPLTESEGNFIETKAEHLLSS